MVLKGPMFARSTTARVLSVAPFAWYALAGCSAGVSAPLTDTRVDAPDSQPGIHLDSGPLQNAVSDDAGSGIVTDDAPAGCVAASVDAGSGASVQPPVGRQLAAGNALSARGVTGD